MAAKRSSYENIDEIIEFVTNGNDYSDDGMGLDDEIDEIDSDWKYEEEPEGTFVSGTVPQSFETSESNNQLDEVTDVNEPLEPASNSSNPNSDNGEASSEDDVPLADLAQSNNNVKPMCASGSRGVRTKGGMRGRVLRGCGRGVRTRGGRGGIRGGVRGGGNARGRPT